MQRSEFDKLRDELRRQKARLSDLERHRAEARSRIEILETQLATAAVPQAPPPLPIPHERRVPTNPAEKVKLFRDLFRGRADGFPTRFVSKKTGKPGYAPACANKFVRGQCELPRIKCGECPNQAFVPVDDRAVVGHLQGRHVMGVYPLLDDETCWFLAVDFDKASWQEDVRAFSETCRTERIPCAVERSRSGDGAHVWFFFASPVPANLARRMGCYLITETMARRHELGMESYDRLFPNQDTMPRGGFGNLIALPLQYEARKDGNTPFLDDRFEPYPDPWAFLASIERIARNRVEEIAGEALSQGRVLAVRIVEPSDETDAAPWTRAPSRGQQVVRIPGPLPSVVRAVLSQRLFVEKEQPPSPLLNQIKRLAAFQNPEFYKKQGMRLSTALTPRIICCAEEFAHHIALPRGCASDLELLLRHHGIGLVVNDQRHSGESLDIRFRGELTQLQQRAARALLAHDSGVFVAPPGTGKTVLGTYLVAERRRSTLVLVHRQPLLDQWVAQLSMFLGLDEKEIGQIGAGKRKPSGRLDVAMIQSLVRRDRVSDIVAHYGHVIVDECHHVPAVSFERVLSEVRARYVVGLTATPHRRDGHHPIAEMQLGPIRFTADPRAETADCPFSHSLIVRETSFHLDAVGTERGIQEAYRVLAHDESRNRLILDDVLQAVEEGRSPILLTERKDHLELLADRLRKFVRHLVVLKVVRRRGIDAALQNRFRPFPITRSDSCSPPAAT